MLQYQVRNVITRLVLIFTPFLYILIFCTGKLFHFLITLLLIIFSNLDISKISHNYFPVWKKIFFSDIDPIISFIPKMVSCYFKILKLLVILICILIILIFTLYEMFYPQSDYRKGAALFDSYSYSCQSSIQ